MKKISIFATALLLAWGCVNDFDENITPEGTAKGAFNVIASADNDNRTAYSEVDGQLTASWKAADEIDIISMVDGGEAPYEKLTYTADAAGTKVAFSPKTDALTLKEGGQNYKFYAYYHYFKNEADTKFTYENGVPYLTCHMNGKTNNWSIQGAVDCDGTKRLYQFDLLWANPVAVANPSGNVDLNFQFNHAFAVLEFKLTTTSSEDIKLKLIQVDAAGITDNAVKVNLADGSLTNSKLQNTCKMNFNVNFVPTLKANGANSYSCYMTILPGHKDKKFTITITDQNDKTYTFEKTPSKAILAGQKAVLPLDVNPKPEAPTVNRVEKGVASTTPTKVWSVNLTTLEGVNAANITGIALSNGKLLLSENGNSNPVYLNALTGAKEGTMDVSAVTAANTNYYATSDDAGNILFCNYWDYNGTAFTIYKAASVTGAPASFVTRTIDSNVRTGYKISVAGDVNSAAMITTTEFNKVASTSMYTRSWQVSGGTLVAGTHQRNLGTMQSGAVYGRFSDAIHMDGAGTSDIFFTHYAKYSDGTRYFKQYMYDSTQKKHVEKAKVTDTASGNYSTAVDCVKFNNATYVFVNYVNSFAYKTNDVVRMYDVTSGDLATASVTNVAGNHVDGSVLVNGKQNSNGLADVLAHVDGDYMYVYVMFANGNVSCYKYTCLAE